MRPLNYRQSAHADGLLIPVYVIRKCLDGWHPTRAGAILRIPQRIGAL